MKTPGCRKSPGSMPAPAMRNVGAEGRQVCAHVAHQVDVHGEELAVLRKAPSSQVGDVLFAGLGASPEKMIGTVGRPTSPSCAVFPRGDRDQGVFLFIRGCRENSFVPNPPPTSGQTTRIFSSGIFSTIPHRIFAQAMAALAADGEGQMVRAWRRIRRLPARVFHEVGDDAGD